MLHVPMASISTNATVTRCGWGLVVLWILWIGGLFATYGLLWFLLLWLWLWLLMLLQGVEWGSVAIIWGRVKGDAHHWCAVAQIESVQVGAVIQQQLSHCWRSATTFHLGLEIPFFILGFASLKRRCLDGGKSFEQRNSAMVAVSINIPNTRGVMHGCRPIVVPRVQVSTGTQQKLHCACSVQIQHLSHYTALTKWHEQWMVPSNNKLRLETSNGRKTLQSCSLFPLQTLTEMLKP
jgi:hypothetical protein